MAHEQSETVQNSKGRWLNVYGQALENRGKMLPNSITYKTSEEAVKAAEQRSQNTVEDQMDSINKGRPGIPDNAKPPKKKGK